MKSMQDKRAIGGLVGVTFAAAAVFIRKKRKRSKAG